MIITVKLCCRCKEEKSDNEFPKNRRKPDGLDSACKECTNARMRAKYAHDPVTRANKIIATRKYHVEHPEWSKERLRAHHEANSEERADRARQRGKVPVIAKNRKEATRRAEQRRRAIKSASAQVDLITAKMLILQLKEFDHRCYICDAMFCSTVPLHWDHFQPLAKGGLHILSNLRPACDLCNIRKNAIWPVTDAKLAQIKSEVLACRSVSKAERR